MTKIKIIENYKQSLQAIYDHVGFKEDYVFYPVDDATHFYWNHDKETVCYADSIEELQKQDGNYYEDDIYTQRFYKKYIYKGKDFTLIFCDPHVDGMKYFRLFNNSKKIIE